MSTNIDALVEAWPRIADGVAVTAALTLGGAALAFVLSLVLGYAVGVRNRWMRYPARVVIEFFRGTSLLVQLFWLFYVLPSVRISTQADAVRNPGARPELRRIRRRGRSRSDDGCADRTEGSMHRPGFLTVAAGTQGPLPSGLGTDGPFADEPAGYSSLKGSALASFILLQDLTYQIEQLRRGTGDTIFAFGVGLIVYFVLAYALTLVMNVVEIRAKRRLGLGPSLREVLSIKPDRGDELVGVGR